MYSTNQHSFEQRDNKISTVRLNDATKENNRNKIINITRNVLTGDNGYQNIKKLIYPLLYQIFQVIPVTIPDNEIKNKEQISIGKIEKVFEKNEEDSVPVFAFNNVAFKHRFAGSQLEYVSTVNPLFNQEAKSRIIFRLGVKIIFHVSHT